MKYLKNWKVIFFIYVLLVIKFIVFKYPVGQILELCNEWGKGVILQGLSTANFTLFKTIKMYIRYYDRLNSFENLFGNVLIFIPYGWILPRVHERYKNIVLLILNAFVFISSIEIFQLFSAFGAFDVDDILLNCFGVLIGYFSYCVMEFSGRRKNKVNKE